MVGRLSRCMLLVAAVGGSISTVAVGGPVIPLGIHREDVDVSRHPWSAIGKIYNETGASCSGVAIARDKILTAAHCVFNFRTHRFIPAASLHFLAGYRIGRYTAHARIASYEIGPGFDPLRYQETSSADWAVLKAVDNLPLEIEPLRLSNDTSPSGTKAVIAGYPQDRAFAMTADRDCELGEKIGSGRLLLHTCRGINGYSGAPILVNAGGNEMQIAGIQIATSQSGGIERMIAVPAHAIRDRARAPAASHQPISVSSSDEMTIANDVPDRTGRASRKPWDDVDYGTDVVVPVVAYQARLEPTAIPLLANDRVVLTAP